MKFKIPPFNLSSSCHHQRGTRKGWAILYFTFLLLLNSFESHAQYPSLVKTGKHLSDFIPERFSPIDTCWGDLNKDGLRDFILIVESTDTIFVNDELEGDLNPRILIICIGNQQGFKMVDSSNTFILKKDEGGILGDPYQGISISDSGIISIYFYGGSNWRWALTYKFRFNGNYCDLIGAESVSYFIGDGAMESWSFNFLTNKVKYGKGNMSEDKLQSEKWMKLNLNGLKNFKTFRKPGEWVIDEKLNLNL